MINFYKPNPRNTGHACSFKLSNQDNRFYAEILKQDSWNPATRTGSFSQNAKDPAKKAVVKFSHTEIGGILDSIDTGRAFSAYHDGAVTQFSTSIKFEPYMKDGVQIGHSFSVVKSSKEDSSKKTNFVIGLNFGEGRLLKEALTLFIRKAIEIDVANYAAKSPKSESPAASDGQTIEATSLDV
jgi:hypothetical protein